MERMLLKHSMNEIIHPEKPTKRQRDSNFQWIEQKPLSSPEDRQVELKGADLPAKRSQGQNRASNACETCRLKKVKCTAEHPICSYCALHALKCTYRINNEALDRQLLSTLVERVERMEKSLDSILYSPTIQGSHSSLHATPQSIQETIHSINTTASSASSMPTTNTAEWSSMRKLEEEKPISLSRSHMAVSGNSPYQGTAYQTRHEQYLLHEESRDPLPFALDGYKRPEQKEIISLIHEFFDRVCPLYPIICDDVTFAMASSIVARGFRDDPPSCLILILIALVKAYSSEYPDKGLADFQYASQLLSRLGMKFTLEVSQAHILCGLYVLKRGRVLDFWSYIHTGMTILHTMISRDEAWGTGKNRRQDEKNTILRFYWICINMERDVVSETGMLPCTQLSQLEHTMPLPLSCDESSLTHLRSITRSTYGFFLAEMSLRNILHRILSTPDRELWPHMSESLATCISKYNSPLRPLIVEEFENQIETWRLNVPSFLKWSPEPYLSSAPQHYQNRGLRDVTTRLKLLYWFTRFMLLRPFVYCVDDSIEYSLGRDDTRVNELAMAATKLTEIFLMENAQIDVIMAHRVLFVILFMKRILQIRSQQSFVNQGKDIHNLMSQVVERLQTKVAPDSEWIMGTISEWYT